MMLIDTHTHLYVEDFAPDNVAAVNRAVEAGVGKLIMPNIDAASVGPMRQLHEACPENTYMAIGLHPTELTDESVQSQLEFVRRGLGNHGDDYVAIGEVGIDLYWDKSRRDKQMQVFDAQLRMASEKELPVIIHCRDGLDEALEVIEGLDRIPPLLFHSFGGNEADVARIRRYGDFMFGINGIVTFRNSGLRNVLPAIGIDRILLETDSPYLAPVPLRGRRNESAFMIHTAAHVASSLGLTADEVADVTTRSALNFFRI